MAIAYFDCPTGIAGDMCLGAFIDAGMPLADLEAQLARLNLPDEYDLAVETVQRQGQRATKLWVRVRGTEGQRSESAQKSAQNHGHNHEHEHQRQPELDHAHSQTSSRHLPEIIALIDQAGLPERVRAWSTEVFHNLAQAEAKVHGIPAEQVHFHEVGAVDAIVDIVGTCIALNWFGIERLYCSALPTGGGTVSAAHGRLPVPVPAVLQLWQQRQVPLYSNGIQRELVTPTGAALAVTLAAAFGPPPPMTIQRLGLGAGAAELSLPNALRVWIGAESPEGSGASPAELPPPALGTLEPIAILETQIDDLSPQVIGYLFERLLGAGALDVFTQAVGMKKSRPGILISVVCRSDRAAACEQILFQETSTLGVRRRLQQRSVLQRDIETAQTPYGPVRVKVARSDRSMVINAQPEYEDCARLARETGQSLREIHKQAILSWTAQKQSDEAGRS
ncbi:MAG: nickel pincer cofactor biosynthesis protein LarC [Elainellaceae cyanobacterium]